MSCRAANWLILLGILAGSAAAADWKTEYEKRHPDRRKVELRVEAECAQLTDPVDSLDCVKEVQAGYAFEAKASELKADSAMSSLSEAVAQAPYLVDEQRIVTIKGADTTITIVQVKSRSGRAVADQLDGIRGVLRFTAAVTVVFSLVAAIALFSN